MFVVGGVSENFTLLNDIEVVFESLTTGHLPATRKCLTLSRKKIA
jgi:hypothetical protein